MRKLATAASGFAGALILAHYLLPDGYLPLFAAGLAVLTLLGFLFRGDARLRVMLLCVSASLGLSWYFAYDELMFVPAEALVGETRAVMLTALEYPVEYERYRSVTVSMERENGPALKILVYDYEDQLHGIRQGDVFEIELRFVSATESRGDMTDSYASRGIALRGYTESAPLIVAHESSLVHDAATAISSYIKDSIDGLYTEDVSAYMRALLTGDKSGLYADRVTYNELGVAGILHTVAISGMHISFLWSFVLMLSGSKRRRAAIIGLPLVWLFALMTGLSPSALRAAFMLSLGMLAPLIGREADGLTSLSAALLILLLLNPKAIASISLQLSFTAMLGIITVSPRILEWLEQKWKAPEKRGSAAFRKFLMASFSSSIGAIVFTTPLCYIHFGYISLVSPLTNLLVLWAVSLCFIGGALVVAAGAIAGIAGGALVLAVRVAVAVVRGVIAWAVAWLVRYILFVAGLTAAIPGAALYAVDGAVLIWLALTYAVFIAEWLMKKGKPFRPAIPASVSVLGLSALMIYATLFYSSGATITVMDVGQGQSIVVFDGSGTLVIDCGSTTEWDAGNIVADYLAACGRSAVDVLVLTHLHADHTNGVADLMRRTEVGKVMLSDASTDDDGTLFGISESAVASGAELIYVGEDTVITQGNLRVTLFGPSDTGDENERGLIILVSIGDYDMLVTGDVNASVERSFVESNTLPDMELLIVGHHGSRYSTALELLRAVRAETAVISVGYNHYGHPAEEVLDRLTLYEMDILRTDLDGNVVIRVG